MIVIVTPYDHSETTWAALRLADLVLACGQEARIVPLGKPQQGVHGFWDPRVWSSAGDGLYRAAIGAQAVVHFQASMRAVDRTSLVAERALQVLVPRWHALRDLDDATLLSYHRVVATSQGAYMAVLREVQASAHADAVRKRLSWHRFDCACVSSRQRTGVLQPGAVSACVVADAATISLWSNDLLVVLRGLLEAQPSLRLTLLSPRSWPERGRRLLRQLEADFSLRFVVSRLGGFESTVAAFHAADWAILPSVRYDFGMLPLRAAACGCGVLALDVWPLTEIVPGSLRAPCHTLEDAYGAPTAVPNAATFLAHCREALASEAMLDQVRAPVSRAPGPTFQAHWSRLLGLDAED